MTIPWPAIIVATCVGALVRAFIQHRSSSRVAPEPRDPGVPIPLERRGPSGPVPLERQLSTLASCGIRLAPSVSPQALTSSVNRESLEASPYRLLAVMGGEAETQEQVGETGYRSDNIWHFDTECVEDHDAYAAIARRLCTLAQGQLPLEEISDYVDVEAGEARLTFRLADREYRWEAKVNDDWVDPTILSRFAELLKTTGKDRRFTYIDLGGQDCLIGCATAEERKCLARETGLEVEWLT
jgi:hypothetical protein